MILPFNACLADAHAPKMPCEHRADRETHHARQYVREQKRQWGNAVGWVLKVALVSACGCWLTKLATYTAECAVAKRVQHGLPAENAVAEGGHDKVYASNTYG